MHKPEMSRMRPYHDQGRIAGGQEIIIRRVLPVVVRIIAFDPTGLREGS